MATIWSLMESVREARTLWRTAVDQVNGRLKNSAIDDAAAERARAAIQALDLLPWDGAIKGFKAGGTISDLADWFTTDWLRTDHEEQMLELLASDLGLSDGSTSCIQNTYFVKALAEACSDPEKYRTARKFGWLRRLGASFATKDRTRLGTIANKNESHWVTLTIDCDKKAVGYGDGFRAKPSSTLREHVNWWLSEHLGMDFKWSDIPVATQKDPHSCGILGYFDLAHWFDPERFPLPQSTAASMADERIKIFLRIVERHQKKAGDFASDARDYEFTFAHSLGFGKETTESDDGESEKADTEDSPSGSEYSAQDDDSDSVSD
ncbi:hypothetical protein DFH08DRAFT_720203, partial [Mycena albidolilacea]